VIWRLPKMLEREWRVQAHEILGLPARNAAADLQPDAPHSQCPHCATGSAPGKTFRCSVICFCVGAARQCKTPISKRYPLTELACGLFSAFVAWHFGFGWQAGMYAADLGPVGDEPDRRRASVAAGCAGAAADVAGVDRQQFGLFASLHDALWGAVAGYMALWSVFWLFKLITGKDGMGHGDFKLLAMLAPGAAGRFCR
jgi:leader peptidase (prepilin peptidase)/N-methyltransferase